MALEEYDVDLRLRWVVVPTFGGVGMEVPRGHQKQHSIESVDRLGMEIYAVLRAAGVGEGALAGACWGVP